MSRLRKFQLKKDWAVCKCKWWKGCCVFYWPLTDNISTGRSNFQITGFSSVFKVALFEQKETSFGDWTYCTVASTLSSKFVECSNNIIHWIREIFKYLQNNDRKMDDVDSKSGFNIEYLTDYYWLTKYKRYSKSNFHQGVDFNWNTINNE